MNVGKSALVQEVAKAVNDVLDGKCLRCTRFRIYLSSDFTFLLLQNSNRGKIKRKHLDAFQLHVFTKIAYSGFDLEDI